MTTSHPRVDSCSTERLVNELVNRARQPKGTPLTSVNDALLCQLNAALALEINRRFGEF